MKTAVLAGTFDPFTLGHLDIAKRAAKLFDKLVIGVADYGGRKAAPIQTRLEIAKGSVSGIGNIEVLPFKGFLADFARTVGSKTLVRGLRTYNDFEYEKALFEVYKSQETEIEVIYIMTSGIYSHISGSIVRELASLGGDLSGYVACSVVDAVKKNYSR